MPGKSHDRRSLVGYSSRGHRESDTTERLHFHFLVAKDNIWLIKIKSADFRLRFILLFTIMKFQEHIFKGKKIKLFFIYYFTDFTVFDTVITVSRSDQIRSVAQSCLTLCDPIDSSPPGSSVHGILQAKTLEWIAMPFSRGSSQPRA